MKSDMPFTPPYKCIIVDDDEVDRLTTLSFVRKYPFLTIAGVYASAEEALVGIKNTPVDVLFLDIDMPGLTGLDLRRQLLQTPVCIFITAYPDYAVESFELAALDFLVKPLKTDRFLHTMNRLQDYFDIKRKAALFECSVGGDTIFIKEGHDQIKIKLHEIVYLEALKDYTHVVTTTKKYCVLFTLGNLLKEAAFKTFIRIHRSYAVQQHFIEKIAVNQVTLNTAITLPVGRSYRNSLEELKMNKGS
ncbi:LytR/AlgR family response regulator transcription factor [Longitalea luteola]|uniref:LytR/AlgR family response regulator transcription factor n=1 Tax=Longitalea luteola TaxID=2812563 RepID=UPI001F60DFC6|nr:LytTR family DNA-binding domain-containing protein [Longitalea luteola]